MNAADLLLVYAIAKLMGMDKAAEAARQNYLDYMRTYPRTYPNIFNVEE